MPIAIGSYGPFYGAGAPAAGTNEVQTATIGGTPTGGTFTLAHEGFTTAPITWVNVNATLLAAIQAALVALPSIGAAGVVAAAGTLTAGIGTLTLTFGGNRAGQPVGLAGLGANNMTGTTPTLAVARTTPGVEATGRGAACGATYTDNAAGKIYIQTSTTTLVPTWVSVGSQT